MRRAYVLCAAGVVMLALLVAGCGSSKPAPTYSATDPAGKEACYQIQIATENKITQYMMAHPEFRMRMNLQAFVDGGALDKVVYCPAGGDYAWNPNSGGELWCSIHQHHQ
jgi:hypothetical protein